MLDGREVTKSGAPSRAVFSCVSSSTTRGLIGGVSRAIPDWEYHAVIYDVAVHPDYQRRSFGSRMLSELLVRLPVWRVILVSDDADAQRFYRRLGFADYPDVLARLDRGRLYADASHWDQIVSHPVTIIDLADSG